MAHVSGTVPFASTLRDRIVMELRDRIVGGVLPTGTKLNLDGLAEEFGSSRTPVREALLQLAHDGLVEVVPRRGVHVTGMSPAEIFDNFVTFGATSGIAAEWTARRVDAELIARLQARSLAMDGAHSGPKLVKANWDFHAEIHRACGSAKLCSVIGQLSRTMPVGYTNLIPEHSEVSAAEHVDLLRAIENGDAELARTLSEEHFRNAGLRMLQHLKSGEAVMTPSR